MDHIYSKGRAKINLALDITGKRGDGYHAISTVMQSLALYDGLYIKKVYKPDYLKLVSDLSWLPCDERNLAWQAAKYMIDRFDLPAGIFIKIQKMIPASAGLAGGSADCAAALLGIRNLFDLPLSDREIQKLSVQFGADVPFCVMPGCAHATGIGEVLEPLPVLPYMNILLAKPPAIVSTEDVFKNYDPDKVKRRPDMEKLKRMIEVRDLPGLCACMANVLESVTAVRYPIIEELKAFMMNHGAAAAMMTGSGPAVFGIFEGKTRALLAGQALRTTYPEITEVFVTRPYYPGWNSYGGGL